METGALRKLLAILTDIEALGDEERGLLFHTLEEEYGWGADTPGGENRGVSVGDFGPWEDGTIKDYDVILVDAGQERLPVLKILREACGVDPAGAKELLGSLPAIVGRGLDLGEARGVQKRFSDHGARTELCESAHVRERLEELKRGGI